MSDSVAHQPPLSMEFSRQKYWSGLPFLSAGDLPDPGMETVSLAAPVLVGRFFTPSTTWEAPDIWIHVFDLHPCFWHRAL